MKPQPSQHGFVLITSLIFLVVITLLAVTAMNRSTLQQKIATNTQVREIARQHATAALNEAERILSSKAFDTYEPAGPQFQAPKNKQDAIPANFHIWRQGEIPGTGTNTPPDFLDPGVWDTANNQNKPGPIAYTADDDKESATKYFVEELDGCYQANRSPKACATGRSVTYRITARSTKGSAEVVVQSTFVKQF